jgi:hypothetical protein
MKVNVIKVNSIGRYKLSYQAKYKGTPYRLFQFQYNELIKCLQLKKLNLPETEFSVD